MKDSWSPVYTGTMEQPTDSNTAHVVMHYNGAILRFLGQEFDDWRNLPNIEEGKEDDEETEKETDIGRALQMATDILSHPGIRFVVDEENNHDELPKPVEEYLLVIRSFVESL